MKKVRKPAASKTPRRVSAAAGADLLRAVMEHSADAVVLIDQNAVVLYSSPAVKRMLGYEPEERVGQPALEPVHPDDLPEAERMFAQLLAQPDLAIAADIRC